MANIFFRVVTGSVCCEPGNSPGLFSSNKKDLLQESAAGLYLGKYFLLTFFFEFLVDKPESFFRPRVVSVPLLILIEGPQCTHQYEVNNR